MGHSAFNCSSQPGRLRRAIALVPSRLPSKAGGKLKMALLKCLKLELLSFKFVLLCVLCFHVEVAHLRITRSGTNCFSAANHSARIVAALFWFCENFNRFINFMKKSSNLIQLPEATIKEKISNLSKNFCIAPWYVTAIKTPSLEDQI